MIKNIVDNNMIGRFSALACSNAVHITSYYEGIKYNYLMLKSGNNINIDLLSSTKTEEPNGVEVSIQIDFCKDYVNLLYTLVYFPNIYIKDNTKCKYSSIEEFNNCKIRKGKYYACNTEMSYSNYDWKRVSSLGIVLGNVLYPLKKTMLDTSILQKITDIEGLIKNVNLLFEVGELEVTPNREEILYSSKNIKTIEKRVNEALEELTADVKSIISKDYDDILDYVRVTSEYIYVDLVNKNTDSKTYNLSGYYHRYTRNLLSPQDRITYKGNALTANSIYYHSNTIPNLCAFYSGGFWKKYTEKSRHALKIKDIKNSENIVWISKDLKLTESLLSYIASKYNKCIVIKEHSKLDFCDKLRYNREPSETLMCNELYDYIYNNAFKIHLNDPDFIKYKKDNRKTIVKDRNTIKTLKYETWSFDKKLGGIMHNWHNNKSLDDLNNDIANTKGRVIVLNPRNQGLNTSISLINYFGITKVFSVNSDIINKVTKHKNMTTLDECCSEDTIIRYGYVYSLFNGPTFSQNLMKLFNSIACNNIKNKINILLDDFKSFEEGSWEYRCFINGKYRELGSPVYSKYENLVAEIKPLYEKFIKLDSLSKSYDRSQSLLCYLAIKSKAFNINYDAYKSHVKNNPLIKLLKNENY